VAGAVWPAARLPFLKQSVEGRLRNDVILSTGFRLTFASK